MKIKSEIYNLSISTLGIVILALSINLLSWQYHLISSGLPGYALIANYTIDISVGTFLLIANTIILLTSFVLAGKTSGLRGVYGYVILSLLIDFSRKTLALEQISTHNFLQNAFLLSLQGFTAPIGIAIVISHGYSFGSYSSMLPIIDKFKKVSPPKFFLILDLILALITLILFGFQKTILLLINAIVFFVVFKCALDICEKYKIQIKKVFIK